MIVALIFNLLFVVCACSGSEDAQYTNRDNEEEFVRVEQPGQPTIPSEDKLEPPHTTESPTVSQAQQTEDIPQQSIKYQEKPQAHKQDTSVADTYDESQIQTNPPVEEREIQTQSEQVSSLMMWSVQIGAFKDEAGAIRLAKEAKNQLEQPIYKDYDPVTGFYKVTVGSFATQEQASKFRMDVRSAGFPDAFTVEVRR